jgi:hypothetical protein
LEQGARVGGVSVGAGLTVVFTGPLAVVLAPCAGYLLGELAAWASGSAFSPLEQERLETAVVAASQVAENREEAGDVPRGDDFFAAPDGGAPWGAELFEAAMKASARDHESRKASHLGRFWINVAYDESIDVAYATYLLRLATAATYRQLVILALFSRAADEPWQARLLGRDLAHDESGALVAPSLDRELRDLASDDLIGWVAGGTLSPVTGSVDGHFAGGQISMVRPRGAGADLARLLDLDLIPQGEFEPVLADLGEPSR